MKAFSFIILLPVFFLAFLSCKKISNPPTVYAETTSYNSMSEFYSQNGVKTETFSINSTLGGSFVSLKGTTVAIPANAFKDSIGNVINGIIKFSFKDIYDKSDMIISDMPTNSDLGAMKSAGEFYLDASYNNYLITSVKTLTISQPSNKPFDAGMQSLTILRTDTAKFVTWTTSCGPMPCGFSITYSAPSYQYYIYSNYFSSSPMGFHWFNTDNLTYFSAFTQTTLSIINTDTAFDPDVFLVFSSENAVFQVYNSNGYTYAFAPVGLTVNIVAVGLKNGILMTEITPLVISPNQTHTLNLKASNITQFTTALKGLN